MMSSEHDMEESLRRELELLRQAVSGETDSELAFRPPTSSDFTSSSAIVYDESSNSASIGPSSSGSWPVCVKQQAVSCCPSDVPSACSSVRLSRMRSLRHCLDLNLEYQASLRNYINAISQAKLKITLQIFDKYQEIEEESRERKDRDNVRPAAVILRPGSLTLCCFRKPYFRNVFGIKPPVNDDVKLKSILGEELPSHLNFSSGWKWFDAKMKDNLFSVIRRECLAKLLEPHIAHRDELRQLSTELDGRALQCIKQDLAIAERTINKLARESKDVQLYENEELMARIDWHHVAKELGSSVTSSTVKLVWTNYHAPTVNKTPFKADEDNKLMRLVRKYKERNWALIALKLGTKRSPFQCLQRYQAKLVKKNEANVISRTRLWNASDDERLLAIVSALGGKDSQAVVYVDWKFVSQSVGGFSPSECSERFIQLSVKLNNGPWSSEEHAKLEQAVKTFGSSNWVAVSTFVVTRSPNQCLQHWEDTVHKQNVEEFIEKCPAPEWSVEEDAILWFNKHSKSAFLRNYSELSRALPGRLKKEIKDRFNLLKLWQRQAEWLLKNEGTLLDLVMKSDADLTMAEVQKLCEEMSRLKSRRRRVPRTQEEATRFSSISFAEQVELERLTNAMVVEASLSQDLVRDKVKLLKDIVNLKAVPVPLLRNVSKRQTFMTDRTEAFDKIREMLIKHQAKRRASAHRDISASTQAVSQPKLGHIMAKIRNATKDPALADIAREVLLRLENVSGGTQVRNLIRISHQLDALASKKRAPSSSHLSKIPNASAWSEIRDAIHLICQPKIWKSTPTQFQDYYESFCEASPEDSMTQSDYTAKLLLTTALSGNLNELTAEAEEHSRFNATLDQQMKEIAEENRIVLPSLEDSIASRLQRVQAECSLRALKSPVNEHFSRSGIFSSVSSEFNATCHVSPGEVDQTLPPNLATSDAYRLISRSATKLRSIFSEGTSAEMQAHLRQKVLQLKACPTSGYNLLAARFKAMFAWPALLDRVEPIAVPYLRHCQTSPPRRPSELGFRHLNYSPSATNNASALASTRPVSQTDSIKPENCVSESSLESSKSLPSISLTPMISMPLALRVDRRQFALEMAERAIARHKASLPAFEQPVHSPDVINVEDQLLENSEKLVPDMKNQEEILVSPLAPRAPSHQITQPHTAIDEPQPKRVKQTSRLHQLRFQNKRKSLSSQIYPMGETDIVESPVKQARPEPDAAPAVAKSSVKIVQLNVMDFLSLLNGDSNLQLPVVANTFSAAQNPSGK